MVPLTSYRPDVDGLRALAVMAVLLFHADFGCPGGFVGVDVFFVISGYLITGLIWKDLERGRFQLRDFWARRMRRILPVLAVVVAFTLGLAWLLYLPEELKGVGQSVVSQALVSSNFFFWRTIGYFSPATDGRPLLHTWSLAVEEQFYLFFPLLLVACRKGLPRGGAALVAGALWLVSFAAGLHMTRTHPSAAFYLLPARAWELLTGSLIVLLAPAKKPAPWVVETVAVAGLLAMLAAMLAYNSDTLFPGAAALLPCAGAAAVIWAGEGSATLTGRLLASPVLVGVGLISYSLYLWHWPLLMFCKYWSLGPLPAWQRAGLLLLSLALAAASWKWVEVPCRKGRLLKSGFRTFSFAAGTLAALVVAGLGVSSKGGFPSRFPPQAVQYAAGADDKGRTDDQSLQDVTAGRFSPLGAADQQQQVGLFLWGDSHARALASLMDVLCREHGVRGLAACHSGTPPLLDFASTAPFSLFGDTPAFNDAVLRFIIKEHVPQVVLAARWSIYGSSTVAHERLLATVKALREAGAKVWVVHQVPRPGWNVPRGLAAIAIAGKDPASMTFSLAGTLEDNAIQDQVFAEVFGPGVACLDPSPYFITPGRSCLVAEGGRALYYDENHLSGAGVAKLRPLFVPLFGGSVVSAAAGAEK